jgi:hypothetical protein
MLKGGPKSASPCFLSVLQFTKTLPSIFLRYNDNNNNNNNNNNNVALNCINKTVIMPQINAARVFCEQLILNNLNK